MFNTKKRTVEPFFSNRCFFWGHPGRSDLHYLGPLFATTEKPAPLNRETPEALGVALCNGVRAYAFHVTRLGFVGALRKKAFQSYLSGAPPGGDGSPIARNSWEQLQQFVQDEERV